MMTVPMKYRYSFIGERSNEDALFINFEKVSDRQVLTVKVRLKGNHIVTTTDDDVWFFKIDKYSRFFDDASGSLYLTPHEFVLSVVNLYPSNNGTEKLGFVRKYKPGGIYSLFLERVVDVDSFNIPYMVEIKYVYNEVLNVFFAYDADCKEVSGEFCIRNGYVPGVDGTNFLTIEEAIVASYNITYKDGLWTYPPPYDEEEDFLLRTNSCISGVAFYEFVKKEKTNEN